MFQYEQITGTLRENGEVIGYGYSGAGAGKNNPGYEAVPSVGPIPRGVWTIGDVFDSETHGPLAMRLTPAAGTNAFGRAGFMLHGDSIAHPGEASKGCLILPRPVRIRIAASEDKTLEVI